MLTLPAKSSFNAGILFSSGKLPKGVTVSVEHAEPGFGHIEDETLQLNELGRNGTLVFSDDKKELRVQVITGNVQYSISKDDELEPWPVIDFAKAEAKAKTTGENETVPATDTVIVPG